MRSFSSHSVPRPALAPSVIAAFGRAPLDLEIGGGQGLHAVRRGLQFPDRTLICVERTHQRFGKLSRRAERHPQATNLFPVHADAISVLTHFAADNSLDNVFLLYPNPYPKARQANLRWHNMPFMEILRARLKPGGRLTLATNIQAYADEAAEKLTVDWGFILETRQSLPQNAEARTHFEKKYLERGETCWNLILRKPSI